jgi:hypothetical protein
MKTRLLPLALVPLVMLALLPSAARADGLPVIDENLAPFGVSTPPVNDVRYMTVPARKGTVLARIDMSSGGVIRSRYLRSRFSVPIVAYDSTASGISANGRTLVLIEPRRSFPRRETTFAVIGALGLRTRDVFTLRGDFSFDAISPDGQALYLIQYLSARDPFRYVVRLYDLQKQRLLPDPIIDPREVGDVMRGMPVTRSSSPDGRFAYTLYDGAGEHPFIHALDTVERTARCIDLHGLMGFQRLGELKLDVSPDGGTIAVALNGKPEALVDTRTNEVVDAPPAAAPRAPADAADPRSVPWLLFGGVAAGLLLVLLLVQRRPKRRRPARSPELELGDLLLNEAPRERERPRAPVG